MRIFPVPAKPECNLHSGGARENLSVYRRCSGDKCKIPLLFAGGTLSEMKVYPGEQSANFPVPRSGIQSPIRGLKEEICIFDCRCSGNQIYA